MPAGCIDPPQCGGEIDGLESAPGVPQTNPNSGVAYLFSLRSLWTDSAGGVPPRPHQYIVGEASHCGGPLVTIDNISATRIAGGSNEQITNIAGIQDFNEDGRNDIAVGAPMANNGDGRLYIAFRREQELEDDFVLEKLGLAPNDPERLAGVLIVPNPGSGARLGSSLATGLDFNHDGVSDLVVSAPGINGGTGEVYVIYGSATLVSPLNGVTLDVLLAIGRAARITGIQPGGQFGFNIANAGDVDGDGTNDLLVAAPNASPFFDANPNDNIDTLTLPGVDLNLNGLPDDVDGPCGVPDGVIDSHDQLTNAGLVYVILGLNQLQGSVSLSSLGTSALRGAIIVGRHGVRTPAQCGNNPAAAATMGDRLGGGDAGDTTVGGIMGKMGRGRSFGLSAAGDVDGDGRADILIGSILADSAIDPNNGNGRRHAGEAYLIYGFAP
jgi:hypothetical protein